MKIQLLLFAHINLILIAPSCGNKSSTKATPIDPAFPVNFLDTYKEARDCRFSHEHYLRRVKVFCDPIACDIYLRNPGNYPDSGTYPVGAKLLKLEYDDSKCQNLLEYSWMEKLPQGAAPALGDWQWKRFTLEKQATAIDAARECVSCHTSHCGSPPNGFDRGCAEELSLF